MRCRNCGRLFPGGETPTLYGRRDARRYNERLRSGARVIANESGVGSLPGNRTMNRISTVTQNRCRKFPSFIPRILALSFLSLALTAEAQTNRNESKLRWLDAKELCIEGKGWNATQQFYDRLPAKADGVVREPVWNLSKDSAGISVRFVTDATEVWARWALRKEKLALPHMPASGVSGVDLYVRHKGKWRWLGAARPAMSRTNENRLTSGMTPQPRECLLTSRSTTALRKLKSACRRKRSASCRRPVRRK